MGFKCGIVGLPNVGKSTLFNALTAAKVDAANYPFCTIDPNVGMVAVEDPRLEALAKITNAKHIIPATVEFVDIAGLVKGAAHGEGLGNQFLSHIRETQVIVHTLRVFTNENISHVYDRLDPIADSEIINTELMLADHQSLTNEIERRQKTHKGKKLTDSDKAEFSLLEEVIALLESGHKIIPSQFSNDQQKTLKKLNLISAKPMLYVANVDEQNPANNPALNSVMEMAENEGTPLLVLCAEIEAQIASLEPEEQLEFLKEIGQEKTGLTRLAQQGYELLGLQTYFTAGPKEVRAWVIKAGDNALEAAGKIHTDFQKGFIRAEVVGWEEFVALGGEKQVRTAGKLRSEGREYILADGDVLHFLFNV